jgi:hypothetical protein
VIRVASAALLALVFQLGCEAQAPAPPQARSDAPVAAPARPGQPTARGEARAEADGRYDLQRDEKRGGHTLARHVGKSDQELRDRLRREPRISAASTYSDLGTAERVVARALDRERARVDKWLGRRGSRPNLALDYRGDQREPIGRSLTRRSSRPVACSDAVVVLRWDGRRGFFVLTSYPEVSR